MKCSRCQNTDPVYFYFDGKKTYCRKCIQFGRIDVGEVVEARASKTKKFRVKEHLDFELTTSQKEASAKLNQFVHEHKNCLVYACCGAGKTEICFEMITDALREGKNVGFAISRRQVVLEILVRLQSAYPKLKVTAVCQGFTEVDEGDIIVCTMHQLYRYPAFFDVLIMDEVDAFPFKNNRVLENVALQSVKGVIVYLTATPDEKMLSDVRNGKLEMIELFVRPHGHPLICPKVYHMHMLGSIIFMIYLLHKREGQWLIFIPTIDHVNQFTRIFKHFYSCDGITSKTTNKEEIIECFRNRQLHFLFTSTILERGITLKGVNVIVLEADHCVFDEASLIQIVGRVGRSKDQPTGEAYLLARHTSLGMKRCVEAIKRMNGSLPNLLS